LTEDVSVPKNEAKRKKRRAPQQRDDADDQYTTSDACRCWCHRGFGGAIPAAGAQSFPFTSNQRYPDPAVQILDPSFAKYRIYSSTLEQVATGMRWAEGPAYFPKAATSCSNPRFLTWQKSPFSVSA